MQNAEIRLAQIEDARRILEIYAPYVAETSLTLTSVVPTLEQVAQTMLTIKKHYPYLVCSLDDKVVGFAYAYRQSPHAAYLWNADLAIFIDPEFQGLGIATALYTALFQILKIQGYCNLYAVITIPNDASVALHKHFGFSELVVMKKSGFKLGRWHDNLYMELNIPGCADPAEHGRPLPMQKLKQNELDTIFAMASLLLSNDLPLARNRGI